jgi:NAD(P)H-hydrate epimerase
MERVLTPNQMKQAEAASEKLGVSLWRLMKNAGAALAEFAANRAERLGAKNVLILCGSGNNGGDGFVCAEILAQRGINVKIALMSGQPKTELAKKAFAEITDKSAVSDSIETLHLGADIKLDCIFGTGFHGEFRGNLAEILTAAGKSRAYKIACDMPSGIDSRRGTAASGTLCCDATLTFHSAKYGMLISPARKFCGEIITAEIGIPEGWTDFCDDPTDTRELTASELHRLMPIRPEHSHKGTFGKLLTVCGCESYIGAAAINSRAALHTGCGIVNLAAPKGVISAIAGHAPECVYTPLPSDSDGFISGDAAEKIIELAKSHDAVVIGCGLGQTDGTRKIVEEVIKNVEKPILIDADGINQLAKNIDVLRDKKSEIILTPHIGELARLCGLSAGEVAADRYEICRRLTREYGITLHSKDTTSLTFDKNQMYITNFGCSALAKGGSGDMLAGVIGSMLAQGKNPPTACVLGDYIMGRTAEILCEEFSPAAITATDIIGAFKSTLRNL